MPFFFPISLSLPTVQPRGQYQHQKSTLEGKQKHCRLYSGRGRLTTVKFNNSPLHNTERKRHDSKFKVEFWKDQVVRELKAFNGTVVMYPPAGFSNKWNFNVCGSKQMCTWLVLDIVFFKDKVSCDPRAIHSHHNCFQQLKKVDVIVLSHS